MIPTNAVALIVFLVAVAPGYVYQRIVEHYLSRRTRSNLVEAIDLLCVGASCTAVGAMLALALGQVLPAAFVRIQEITSPVSLLSWRHIGSAAFALAVSVAVAVLIGFLQVRVAERAARLDPGTVWTNTFTKFAHVSHLKGQRTAARPIYLVVQLRDGRMVGGQLAFSDLGEDPDKRDLTLAAPLWIAGTGSVERRPQPFAFMVVSGDDIALIWGRALA